MYAGMAFANSPVGAVHALAYPIGSHFKVSHGLSNSLVLSRILEFNAPVAAKEYAEIAPCMFPEIERGTDAEVCDRWIEKVRQMGIELEIPQRLSDVGIKESDLDFIAAEAMKQ